MNTTGPDYDFKNKRVVVMGLGRFGGGIGVTRWLVEQGADVLVTDQADKEALASSSEQLADLFLTQRLEIVYGSHSNMLLDDADVLVVNPAVPQPWNHPFIQHAKSQGMMITTEIEIAYRRLNPNKTIALTGSAGKSTTSAMIHHALCKSGFDTILTGNIGGSVLNQLDNVNEATVVVLELSSAMIYWLWGRDSSSQCLQGPQVACVTNYMPNHLDWHGCESHYQESKKQLLQILPESSTAVLGASIANWSSVTVATSLIIQNEITDCATPGKHNATNAAMAVQAVQAMEHSVDQDALVQAVRSYAGLPHRLNLCHQANGIRFFNDSKSTVPEATILAVEAIAEHTDRSKIHLIAGGADKGSDLSSIVALQSEIAKLYTIGNTGQSLAHGSEAIYCGTLGNAIKRAFKNAQVGDVILLSPGCASWDQFANYEHRGNHFVSLAKQLSQKSSCSNS